MKEETITVTRPFIAPYNDYIEEIKDLWDTRQLTNNGIKHKQLEQNLLAHLDAQNLVLFSHGHIALEAAIQTLELTGEVITTPFSFISTTLAIVRSGLTPVFCDINMDDYTIDVTKIEALITEKTTAIIPVHVFGNVCNIEAIEQLAKKYNLKVIYDAAHAFGVTYKNKSIANYGDISMYSFHATKIFHTIEGGCLTFNNPIYKEKLESYKNFGLSEDFSIKYIGTNSKMNEFQAAMGICNLKYIDEEILKRSKVINKYYEKLHLISGMKLLPDIVNTSKNFSHFPVIFDGFKKSRDQIYDELLEYNIHTKKYFYPLTSEADYFNQEYDTNKTPIAKFISERILILPLYGDLELDIVEKICNIILS